MNFTPSSEGHKNPIYPVLESDSENLFVSTINDVTKGGQGDNNTPIKSAGQLLVVTLSGSKISLFHFSIHAKKKLYNIRMYAS